jgi:hypothetical protein
VAPTAAELSPRPTTVFPTKILEYMACKRAVVAPRVGTVTMLMRDRQHGLLFNPGDASSLTTQLARLLSDEDLRDRLARGGYDMIRRTHSASATRRAVRRAFSWLATQGPWSEKWNRTDEVEDKNLVEIEAAGDEITESIGFGQEPGPMQSPTRQPISYTAEQAIFVSDDVAEPDELTVVENTSLDTRESPLREVTKTDDWVVADHPETDSFEVRFDSAVVSEDSSPLESRFVAGELEVAPPREAPTSETEAVEADAEPAFTAMGAPLGVTPPPELLSPPVPRSPKLGANPPTARRTRQRPRPTEKSEPPAMDPKSSAPSTPDRGASAPQVPKAPVKMGPPARVSASDAVRSALSAAKRARANDDEAAPRERGTQGAKTVKVDRLATKPSDEQ